MTPEQMLHFATTLYPRYPFEGKFMVYDDKPHIVSVWMNDEPITDLSTFPTRRFIEEDSETTKASVRILRPQNIMNRTQYNGLLAGLNIPIAGIPEEYVTDGEFYVANPGHRVVVESTRPDLPFHQRHRRIRRQALPPEGDIVTFRNYSKLKKELDRRGLIFSNDFSHWRGSTVKFGAGGEIVTRLNAPRL
jgi:hypothetical protein